MNPERPWPALDDLRAATEAAGQGARAAPHRVPRVRARRRETLAAPRRALPPVLAASDSEGLARDDAEVASWHAGGDDRRRRCCCPPPCPPARVAPVGEVLDGVLAGEEVGVDEIVTLLTRARARGGTRSPRSPTSCAARSSATTVTFVRNRNINYTNVCTFKCRFCAFSKGPLSLNLRGDPYLLDLEEIQRRVVEAVECGATEVCLQGGIHPDFDGDYYLSRRARGEGGRAGDPRARLHRARGHRRRAPPRRAARATTSRSRRTPGSATLPGTAAEILDDEVRAVICPDKVNTDEWLEAHRTAHAVGLRSNVTIMFGTVERPVHVARHLVRTRALQKETGGFTEFVPLPFVHMATPIYLQGRARRGPDLPRGRC